MMGMNGAASLCVVATASPRVQDQRIIEKSGGAEATPTVSRARPVLAIFGSSLTASHASASLSGTGPTADTISGEGTVVVLARSTLGMAGMGGGISSTLSTIAVPLAVGVNGGVSVDWDGLE
jgi:hypothetical protein